METSRPTDNTRAETAHIGKSVVIRGELSGSESLYVDGEVEGSIELREHHLTIGPHGKVRAKIHASEVVIHGQLDGNVQGKERVELKKTAVLTGDIVTRRIVIEDGATFKGSIDTQRDAKIEPKRETVEAVAAAATTGFARPSASPASPESLVDQKK